jgi:hypothetical protein
VPHMLRGRVPAAVAVVEQLVAARPGKAGPGWGLQTPRVPRTPCPARRGRIRWELRQAAVRRCKSRRAAKWSPLPRAADSRNHIDNGAPLAEPVRARAVSKRWSPPVSAASRRTLAANRPTSHQTEKGLGMQNIQPTRPTSGWKHHLERYSSELLLRLFDPGAPSAGISMKTSGSRASSRGYGCSVR